MTGYQRDPAVDEFDRKEYLRKNRRRPIEETIAEVGEGRGTLHPICQNCILPDMNKESKPQVTKSGGGKELRRDTESMSLQRPCELSSSTAY